MLVPIGLAVPLRAVVSEASSAFVMELEVLLAVVRVPVADAAVNEGFVFRAGEIWEGGHSTVFITARDMMNPNMNMPA